MLKFGNKYPQLPGVPMPPDAEDQPYIHQDYPKYVEVLGVGRIAHNPDEEAALLGLSAPAPVESEAAKEEEPHA